MPKPTAEVRQSELSTAASVKAWTEIYANLNSRDLSFVDSSRRRDIHSIHPYPAKFTAALPAGLINAVMSAPGAVVDPFCGSGTSLVEALRQGHSAYGFDANPIALLISTAKIARPTQRELRSIALAADSLEAQAKLPSGEANPRVMSRNNGRERHWFPSAAYRELLYIKQVGEATLDKRALAIWNATISAIVVRVSHQDSETRYSWVEKGLQPRETISLFRAKLAAAISASSDFVNELLPYPDLTSEVSYIDYSTASQDIGVGRFDCAIFSPPYPNTFDYHLYHRLRLMLFGHDPAVLRRAEIGAHLKYEPDTQLYMVAMRKAFQAILNSLKPGGVAAMVVGDSIVRGRTYDNATDLWHIAEEVGFKGIGLVKRPIPPDRKSFARSAERLREETIVLLGRPPAPESSVAGAAQTAKSTKAKRGQLLLFPVQQKACAYELQPLEAALAEELDVAADRHSLRDQLGALAPFRHFSSLDRSPTKETTKTFQYYIDCGRGKPAKSTSYFGHGIHAYIGKFYPQIARQLILNSVAHRGLDPRKVVVFDPFSGSGTSLIEACIVGAAGVGVELNPVAALVATGKLQLLRDGFPSVKEELRKLIARTERMRPDPSRAAWTKERAPYLVSWFPAPQLSELSAIYRLLKDQYGTPFGNGAAYFAILSSIVRQSSLQRPTDLRIRRRDPSEVTVSPLQAFRARLIGLLQDVEHWEHAATHLPFSVQEAAVKSCVVQGDTNVATPSVLKDRVSGNAVLVTSPPYAAALPYIDTDRLSLSVLELDDHFGSQTDLERQMIGNREIGTGDRRLAHAELERGEHHKLGSSSLAEFLDGFLGDLAKPSCDAGFRRQNSPAIVFNYFSSIRALFNDMLVVEPGTDFFILIAGNKMNTGLRELFLDTPKILADIASSLGWTHVRSLDKELTSVTARNLAHRTTKAMADEVVLQLRR
jgi:DNA methylase